MDYERHQAINARRLSVSTDILRITDYQVKQDLRLLFRNVQKLWSAADNEMINCRRFGRETELYKTTVEQVERNLKIMEREIFIDKFK